MALSRSRRTAQTPVGALAALLSLTGAPAARAVVGTEAPSQAPGSANPASQTPSPPRETSEEAAHRRLRDFLDAGAGPLRTWDRESVPRLCELWLAYARAAGLPESPVEFLRLRASIPAGMRSSTDYWVSAAITGIRSVDYACPPEEVESRPDSVVGQGPAGTSEGKRRTPILIIGGGAVAAGAVVALAAGGGGSSPAPPATTPPATLPPNVTALHGLYTGRLVTGNSTVSGCGRAATAPCNALLGGNTTGSPATLTFGGDLPNTGVVRPGGSLEAFTYEGPANGLGGAPGGLVIVWRQQGAITGNVLRLEGTATVTSSGRCNGAVFTTLVEATKN